MVAVTQPVANNGTPEPVHADFLAILPHLERFGRLYFRHLRCRHQRAECLQEMRSLGWRWFIRLVQRGKNPADFLKTFVVLLARAVKCGRRVTGLQKAKDVMNPTTQRRHGFEVEALDSSTAARIDHLYSAPNGQNLHDAFEERLRDNTVTPIPDQVQFRIDWPKWLSTLTPRERRIIRMLARDERTRDVADQFEISAGRVSQLRRDFFNGWNHFCGELVN
jgi:hypothetical protein